MKIVKGIGLFFVYPILMLGLGFYAGVQSVHFFYPGDQSGMYSKELYSNESYSDELYSNEYYSNESYSMESKNMENLPEQEDKNEPFPSSLEQMPYEWNDDCMDYGVVSGKTSASRETSASKETLCVDTEYVLEETDVTNHTVVETTWRIPDKYIGMNREQFLEAMENYEAFPPLSEQERGFIGLEVLSFSRERVVVQMNYRYVQPSTSFYLGVFDNKVVVYLEDLETIYIETDIRLDTLPEEVQGEIIQMMWIENETALYNFLEDYSS